MANIQNIAERVFRYVELQFLSPVHAVAMGSLIDIYAHDDTVHQWVNRASPKQVDKLLAIMVEEHAWHNKTWLKAYIAKPCMVC